MTKAKILYIVESFSTGVYSIIKDIVTNLDQTKFDVLIIYSLRDDSPKDIDKDFNQPNIILKYVPMGNKKEYLGAIKSIKTIVKEFNPDAYHVHSSKGGFLGRLAIKGRKNRVFYTPHGLSYVRTDVNSFTKWIFFQLEYWINKFTPSKIIAVSNSEKQNALRITRNVIVINNFINFNEYEESLSNEKGPIVACGRITEARNPSLFNSIAKRFPEEKFLWVGDGPLNELLDSPNISITGLLPRTKAIEEVKKAKLYLQTSLWEGMPVALLEAMALGKPAIASDIIGNRDLVTDQVNGYLCPVSEFEEFIEKIKLTLKDYKLRDSLGLAARTHIKENHNVTKAIKLYESEYLTTH